MRSGGTSLSRIHKGLSIPEGHHLSRASVHQMLFTEAECGTEPYPPPPPKHMLNNEVLIIDHFKFFMASTLLEKALSIIKNPGSPLIARRVQHFSAFIICVHLSITNLMNNSRLEKIANDWPDEEWHRLLETLPTVYIFSSRELSINLLHFIHRGTMSFNNYITNLPRTFSQKYNYVLSFCFQWN